MRTAKEVVAQRAGRCTVCGLSPGIDPVEVWVVDFDGKRCSTSTWWCDPCAREKCIRPSIGVGVLVAPKRAVIPPPEHLPGAAVAQVDQDLRSVGGAFSGLWRATNLSYGISYGVTDETHYVVDEDRFWGEGGPASASPVRATMEREGEVA